MPTSTDGETTKLEQPSKRRLRKVLGALGVCAVLLGAVVWVCRPKPLWRYGGELHEAIAAADRIVVWDIDREGPALLELTDPRDIREVYDNLILKQRQDSRGECECVGHPWIEWFAGDRSLALARVKHAEGLAWDGLDGQGELTLESSEWLVGWIQRNDLTQKWGEVETRQPIVAPKKVPIVVPRKISLTNTGFEQPLLETAQTGSDISGWISLSGSDDGVGVIHYAADGVNRAKQGSQWLYLNQGQRVTQAIGLTSDAKFRTGGVDRLFVGMTVSSIQDEGPNDVDLTVTLVVAESTDAWKDGTRISEVRIRDLTNDNRGDPNSYLDASAVLMLENDKARSHGTTYWLVIENTLADVDGTGMITVDDVSATLAGPPKPIDLPNVLIVFQDDMGYGDAAFMNSKSKIPTPNLDRMASQGMSFTDAHSAATICGPSRVGLLTGTMPDKLGVHGNFVEGGNGRFGPPTLPEGTPTLATLCQQAGYDTAVVGKWGIPSDWDARRKSGVTEKLTQENAPNIVDFTRPVESAERFGFGYRYLYDEQRPFIEGETAPYEDNPRPYGWHENGLAVRDILAHTSDELHESYLRAITDRAIRYIQIKAGLRLPSDGDFQIEGGTDSPFYIHYLTHAPHLPLVPAAQFVGSSDAGVYGDFVVNVDYSLGRLMGALKQAGVAENTLLVFSSDNGPEHYAYARAQDEGHFSMGALRGLKRDLYEGGHRVPMVVQWPAKVKPGSVCDGMVSLTDWYATIAAITKQSPSDSTGRDSMNILPLLTGEAEGVRSLMLQDTAVGANTRAIRVGPWMYINGESGEMNRNREPDWFRELREVHDTPGNELFNLAEDLDESINRIAQDADKAEEIKNLFDRLWQPDARSTPPFAEQGDSDGHRDFYESLQSF